MNFFEPKLKHIGNSIFSVMTAAAQQYNAINLAQGFPDFLPEDEVVKALRDATKKGIHQYAPAAGRLELREIIAANIQQQYNAVYHPDDEITVTAGATLGMYIAITALVNTDDEVIVFSPCYDSYIPAIELAGGKVKSYNLEAPDFSVNWDNFKKLITGKTKLIILNTPHNPTGKVFSSADMKELERIIAGTNIFLLSDEVYENITFDGQKHHSICELSSIKEKTVIVSSYGKTYHTTGWKMGHILAGKVLTDAIRKVHQFAIFSVSTPTQIAYETILKNTDLIKNTQSLYQAKKDYFVSGLKATRFEVLPTAGTYFVLASYQKLSSIADTEFVMNMVKEERVAAIPVSVFYPNKYDQKLIRFCFAKKEETLKKALDKLMTI